MLRMINHICLHPFNGCLRPTLTGPSSSHAIGKLTIRLGCSTKHSGPRSVLVHFSPLWGAYSQKKGLGVPCMFHLSILIWQLQPCPVCLVLIFQIAPSLVIGKGSEKRRKEPKRRCLSSPEAPGNNRGLIKASKFEQMWVTLW